MKNYTYIQLHNVIDYSDNNKHFVELYPLHQGLLSLILLNSFNASGN